MGKTKKQKKAEARQARKQKQKPKNKTKMSEAMKKANVKKEDFPKATNVIGFAKRSQSSKVWHAVNEGSTLLCDSRVSVKHHEGIPFPKNPKYATCKKCLAHGSYRSYKIHFDIEKANTPDVKEEKKEEVKPEKKEEEVKPESKADEIVDDSVSIDTVRNMLTVRINNLEKRLKIHLEEFILKVLNERPHFFVAGKGNNMFAIVHDPSKYIIVDNITQKESELLLPKYLSMKSKWNGSDKPPKEWLSEVTNIFEQFKGELKGKVKLKVRREKPKGSKISLSVRRKKNKPIKLKRHGRK